MDEHVVAILARDEAEALGVIEPLHVTGCSHCESPFCDAFGDSKTNIFSKRHFTDEKPNGVPATRIPMRRDVPPSATNSRPSGGPGGCRRRNRPERAPRVLPPRPG